jgi:hypothetical protein
MTGAEIGGVSLGTAIVLLGAAVGAVVALTFFVAVVKGFLYICRPNEILIFSGRKHTLPNGQSTGYKVVRRGWAVRIPILETVNRMDMRLFMVEVAVTNAYSKNGIPLDVKAIANVKISNNPAHVRNAVERFLGTNPQQIAVVARQTLEGVLREVLAQLTPEEVNEDRLKFAETLKTHAQDDFDKLGLELDVLKVQHVSDEQQYLQNLGRARIALMIRDAQNAENEANQKIAQEQAAARQRAESAQKKSEATVLQKRSPRPSPPRRQAPPRPLAPRPSRSCSACAASWRSCAWNATWCCPPPPPVRPRRRGPAAKPRPWSRTDARRPRPSSSSPRNGRRRARTAARSTSCSSSVRSWRRRWRAWPRPRSASSTSWTAATGRPMPPSWPTSRPRWPA